MNERAFCYGGHRYKMLSEPAYRAEIERLKAEGLSDEQAARCTEAPAARHYSGHEWHKDWSVGE